MQQSPSEPLFSKMKNSSRVSSPKPARVLHHATVSRHRLSTRQESDTSKEGTAPSLPSEYIPLDLFQKLTSHDRNAGFFIYIDLSSYLPPESAENPSHQKREFALAQKLLDEGVFLHPGEEHAANPGWFRLVFTQDEDILREGLRR